MVKREIIREIEKGREKVRDRQIVQCNKANVLKKDKNGIFVYVLMRSSKQIPPFLSPYFVRLCALQVEPFKLRFLGLFYSNNKTKKEQDLSKRFAFLIK